MIRYLKRLILRWQIRQIESDAVYYDLHGCKYLANQTWLKAARMRQKAHEA